MLPRKEDKKCMPPIPGGGSNGLVVMSFRRVSSSLYKNIQRQAMVKLYLYDVFRRRCRHVFVLMLRLVPFSSGEIPMAIGESPRFPRSSRPPTISELNKHVASLRVKMSDSFSFLKETKKLFIRRKQAHFWLKRNLHSGI